MQIKISKDWWANYIREQPGKTQAEKESMAEHVAFLNSPARPWYETMQKSKDQWLDVETDFIFEDQFNTETARVMVKHIDGINFSPEFSNLDDYKKAVQKRYDKDWPGRTVKCAILTHYIKQNFIKDETPV